MGSLKNLFLVVVATLSANAYSAASLKQYEYKCYVPTERDQRIRFSLTSDEMTLYDQVRVRSVNPYKADRGNAILKNAGVKGGNGKMKDRLVFAVDYDDSDVVSETTAEIGEFYVEQELTQGGSKFRNGSYGGYVSFKGHGYSYETYICFRSDKARK